MIFLGGLGKQVGSEHVLHLPVTNIVVDKLEAVP